MEKPDGGAGQTAKLPGRARKRARNSVERTRRKTARELRTVANSLHDASSDLSRSEDSILAPFVGRAADQVGRAVHHLETHSVSDLARDIETFARRRPVLFFGGCLAACLLAARFLHNAARPRFYEAMPRPDGANAEYDRTLHEIQAALWDSGSLDHVVGAYGDDLAPH